MSKGQNCGRLLGVADANNFFVSCERIFRPDLREKPVVVLSNNDGCVVARSNEVKALNVPMGAPYFKWKAFFEHHGVTVFSGNLALYREISKRVVATLTRFTDVIERYSIDESFFNLSIASIDNPEEYCRQIRAAILSEVGIPVSIGISTTKTLCKLASEIAKAQTRRDPKASGVCLLSARKAAALWHSMPPDEIWGFGGRSAKQLRYLGINTVEKLLSKDDDWIRRNLTLRGLQTVHELRGIPCFPLAEQEEKQKSMMVSESFGERLTVLADIRKAVIKHAVTGAFRLRRAGLRAGVVGCWLRTGRFAADFRSDSASVMLSPPSSQTGEIAAAAVSCLEKIYRPGVEYAKAGIFLQKLENCDVSQLRIDDLDPNRAKADRLMDALDSINVKLGKQAVYLAAIHDTSRSDPHKEHLSDAARRLSDKIGAQKPQGPK